MKYWIPVLVKFEDDKRTVYSSIAETFEEAVKNALEKYPSAVEYYHTTQGWVKI